jgi:hypothetical protein
VPAAVYDVTRRETFEDLERIWMKEVEIYSNIEDAVKMVVANKVDLVGGGGRSCELLSRSARQGLCGLCQGTRQSFRTVWALPGDRAVEPAVTWVDLGCLGWLAGCC